MSNKTTQSLEAAFEELERLAKQRDASSDSQSGQGMNKTSRTHSPSARMNRVRRVFVDIIH